MKIIFFSLNFYQKTLKKIRNWIELFSFFQVQNNKKTLQLITEKTYTEIKDLQQAYMSIDPKYNSCIHSLNALETTIKDRDTYWFPTWTINKALSQVKTDFSNLKSVPLSNSSLHNLSIKCSNITSLVKNSTSSKTQSIFSWLFPITLSEKLIEPMTTASKSIFENTPAVKKYKREKLKNEDKKLIKTAYGDKLYPSLFFVSKEFPKVNSADILKLAIEKNKNMGPNTTQAEIEKILTKTHADFFSEQKKLTTSTPPQKIGSILGTELGAIKSVATNKSQIVTATFQNKGLSNPGNNCFMNAFLQDFCGSPERFDRFCSMLRLSTTPSSNINPNKKQHATEALKLLERWKTNELSINENRNLRVALSALCTDFKETPIYASNTTQEDSQNFRSHLIEALETATHVTDAEKKHYPWVVEITKEITHVLKTGKTWIERLKPVMHSDIPIEIKANAQGENCVDIAACCLDLEKDDPEAAKNRKLSPDETSCKATISVKWPKTILMHFKLFTQDETYTISSKHKNVKYIFSDTNDFSIDLSNSTNPCKYQLQSFVIHSGSSIHSGHYYTYRLEMNAQGKNRWIEYNDSHVKEVNEAVIRGLLNGTEKSTTPYLMTFEKIK